MAVRLPRFTSGRPLTDEVTSDKLNQLVDAIRQCELNSGVGYDVNRGPGGTTLTVRPVVLPQGTGAAKDLIGPSNSGISHTDAGVVVNPGVESYNFYAKTPAGSYSTAYVHGTTGSSITTYNTANNFGKVSLESKRTKTINYTPASGDSFQSIGLLSAYQSDVYNASQFQVTPYASNCALAAAGEFGIPNTSFVGVGALNGVFAGSCNVTASFVGGTQVMTLSKYISTVATQGSLLSCSGTTYTTGSTCSGQGALFYYTFATAGTAAGNFNRDSDEANYATGLYSYKRSFHLGDISPVSAKVRAKIRIGFGSFVSVKLNGANVSYTNFETQTTTYIPMEITNGFIDGQNDFEFVFFSSNTNVFPSVSFEFLPTTATIVTTQGFSILTDAQKDLIGDGTPVQVTVGVTSSLYAYNGSGDKGTTASYTFLRDVNPAP